MTSVAIRTSSTQESILHRISVLETAILQRDVLMRLERLQSRAETNHSGDTSTHPEAKSHGPVAIRIAEELLSKKVRDFSFHRVSADYYEQSLLQRASQLDARRVEQLCKSIVMENTQAGEDVQDCSDPRNSKYYLVIVQYCKKFNAERIRSFVYGMNKDKGISKKKYNFRLCPEDVSFRLTGYGHNSVTPIATVESIPIILSKSVTELVEGYFWLGAGEVDLKLGLNTQQFISAYNPFVCDCTF